MAENQVAVASFSLKGVSEALTLIVNIANAVKDIPKFPELRRNEVREALSKSCQLVLHMLGDLRNELRDIAKQAKDYPDAARARVVEIDSTFRWVEKHRDLALCYELDVTQEKLGKPILACISESTSVDKVAFENVWELKVKLNHFLDAERSSGQMIAENLDKLSKLAKESAPIQSILDEINRIDEETKIAQRQFREQEIEIRKEIGA